jgi:hypothetical protein
MAVRVIWILPTLELAYYPQSERIRSVYSCYCVRGHYPKTDGKGRKVAIDITPRLRLGVKSQFSGWQYHPTAMCYLYNNTFVSNSKNITPRKKCLFFFQFGSFFFIFPFLCTFQFVLAAYNRLNQHRHNSWLHIRI